MQSCSSRCLPAFRSGRWDDDRSGRSRRQNDDWPRAGTGIQAILSSPDLTLPAHGRHRHHHYQDSRASLSILSRKRFHSCLRARMEQLSLLEYFHEIQLLHFSQI